MSPSTAVRIFLLLPLGVACTQPPKHPPIADEANAQTTDASVEDPNDLSRERSDASVREDATPSDSAGLDKDADEGGKPAAGIPGNVRWVTGFAEVECTRADFQPCGSDAEIEIPQHLSGKVSELAFFRFDSPAGTSLACVRATIRQVHGHAVITAIAAVPKSQPCCE